MPTESHCDAAGALVVRACVYISVNSHGTPLTHGLPSLSVASVETPICT
ncbi:hypothetical protein [Nannocystis pusilla]